MDIISKVPSEEWVSWFKPIYAPFTGEVIEASDGSPGGRDINLSVIFFNLIFSRPEIIHNDESSFAGNYVIIQNEGLIAFLAHMKCGSVKVKKFIPYMEYAFIC